MQIQKFTGHNYGNGIFTAELILALTLHDLENCINDNFGPMTLSCDRSWLMVESCEKNLTILSL